MVTKQQVEEKVSEFLIKNGYSSATWTNKLLCDDSHGDSKEWRSLESYIVTNCGLFPEDRPMKFFA
jgi:hypothetical protein